VAMAAVSVVILAISPGQFEKIGAVVSTKQGLLMVILKVHVAVLFLASFAV
jgi:hypothetical protein